MSSESDSTDLFGVSPPSAPFVDARAYGLRGGRVKIDQLTIEDAIAAGEQGMQRCADKAVTLGFCTDAARAFVLHWLAEYGASWSESLVDAAKATGRADLTAHEDRAWGSVFSSLSRQHRIRCIEYGLRMKGHATAGARKWSLVQ